MREILVRYMRTGDRAIEPRYATDGSGCMDLFADGSMWHGSAALEGLVVAPDMPLVVNTGVVMEVPPGYVMLIFSRSGHGAKNRVRLSNCVGVIDSDYRGEVMVLLTADVGGILRVKHGDRIAQAMLVEAPKLVLVRADSLEETGRGQGGFGSTGA